MMSVPKVLIVYQHLPHYRHGVFLELQGGTAVDYEFAADTESRDGSIPTVPHTSLRRFHRLSNHWFGPFLWQAGLLGLLLRRKYDAVVFLGDVAYVSTWAGAALCRASRVQVLFWTIGWHRPERGLRKWTRRAFYSIPHGLLLYGRTALKIGRDMGYPADRMTVVGNSHSSCLATAGLPVSRLDESMKCLPEPGREVLTAVIRLNAAKRLDLVVMAAARLGSQGRAVTVLLVGAGPQGEPLRTLAARLGVDLRLIGPTYADDQLKPIYDRTTVTVVPAHAGLTAVQSLAYGRPVITTDDVYRQMPESACVRPGLTGAFYADGSVESLAATIAHWLDLMRTDRDAVEKACREEFRTSWSAQGHATAINAAIARRLRTRKKAR